MQFMLRSEIKSHLQERPPADLAEVIKAERQMACKYFAQGHLRQVWMSGMGTFALFEAASRTEIEALHAQLPLSQAGYVDFEIHDLTPFEWVEPGPVAA